MHYFVLDTCKENIYFYKSEISFIIVYSLTRVIHSNTKILPFLFPVSSWAKRTKMCIWFS